MIHAVHFEDGAATYRNRYVRTEAFARRGGSGPRRCGPASLEPPDFSKLPEVVQGHRQHRPRVVQRRRCWRCGGSAATPTGRPPRSRDASAPQDFGGTLQHPHLRAPQGRSRHRRAALHRLRPGAAVPHPRRRCRPRAAWSAARPSRWAAPACSTTWPSPTTTSIAVRLPVHVGRTKATAARARASSATAQPGSASCPVTATPRATSPTSAGSRPTRASCTTSSTPGRRATSLVVQLLGCEIADPLADDPANAADLLDAPQHRHAAPASRTSPSGRSTCDTGAITKRTASTTPSPSSRRIDMRRFGRRSASPTSCASRADDAGLRRHRPSRPRHRRHQDPRVARGLVRQRDRVLPARGSDRARTTAIWSPSSSSEATATSEVHVARRASAWTTRPCAASPCPPACRPATTPGGCPAPTLGPLATRRPDAVTRPHPSSSAATRATSPATPPARASASPTCSREAALRRARIGAARRRRVDVAHVGNFAAEIYSGQGHLGGLLVEAVPGLDGHPASPPRGRLRVGQHGRAGGDRRPRRRRGPTSRWWSASS